MSHLTLRAGQNRPTDSLRRLLTHHLPPFLQMPTIRRNTIAARNVTNAAEFGDEIAARRGKHESKQPPRPGLTTCRGALLISGRQPMQSNNNKLGAEHKDERRGSLNLDSRYGKIGISAVAAALRYPGDAKNTCYAPADPSPARQHEDAT